MRLEMGGHAERSYHEIGPDTSLFDHCSVEYDRSKFAPLAGALRRARAELVNRDAVADPNGTYRTLEYRDDDEVVILRVEYVYGVASPTAPEFEAAWNELLELFPRSTWNRP